MLFHKTTVCIYVSVKVCMCVHVQTSVTLRTTMNVLNEQYLRTLTLKRTLLKMVLLGAFGAKDFEYRSW